MRQRHAKNSRLKVIALTAFLVLGLAGVATASGPGNPQISACRSNLTGALRIPSDGQCRTGPQLLAETAVQWSITGPVGPQGIPGPAGPAGENGDPGTPGTGSGSTVHIFRQADDDFVAIANLNAPTTSGASDITPDLVLPAGTFQVIGRFTVLTSPAADFYVTCNMGGAATAVSTGVSPEGDPTLGGDIGGLTAIKQLELSAILTGPVVLHVTCSATVNDVFSIHSSIMALPVTVN